MPESLVRIDLFAEDVGHERFLHALVRRLAREAGATVDVRPRSARGGHGRARSELKLYQQAVTHTPDVLLVAIDANCVGWDEARKSVASDVDTTRFARTVIACPDPHIERWFMSDPPSLAEALGAQVSLERRKCERDVYKQQFAAALRSAGQILTLGGAEFADEVVDAMDLFRAGKNEPSLKHCIDDLRAALKPTVR